MSEILRPILTHAEVAAILTASGDKVSKSTVIANEQSAFRKLREGLASDPAVRDVLYDLGIDPTVVGTRRRYVVGRRK